MPLQHPLDPGLIVTIPRDRKIIQWVPCCGDNSLRWENHSVSDVSPGQEMRTNLPHGTQTLKNKWMGFYYIVLNRERGREGVENDIDFRILAVSLSVYLEFTFGQH